MEMQWPVRANNNNAWCTVRAVATEQCAPGILTRLERSYWGRLQHSERHKGESIVVDTSGSGHRSDVGSAGTLGPQFWVRSGELRQRGASRTRAISRIWCRFGARCAGRCITPGNEGLSQLASQHNERYHQKTFLSSGPRLHRKPVGRPSWWAASPVVARGWGGGAQLSWACPGRRR
jgi:hypothetical protein